MDSTSQPPPTIRFGTLSKNLTKILRLRRSSFTATDAALYKPNPSENNNEPSDDHQNEIEVLVANLFAGVSAFKASYAQLQLAQAPYDLDVIHFADRAIVAQFKRLSELKQGFLNRAELKQSSSRAQAQVQEQLNILKTYKIITAKLESEIRTKQSEISSLRSKLRAAEKHCRTLEARLRPGRTLAALDDLHLSGLNPTHFLTLLRSTVKSIRSFVKIMVQHMISAGWDLSAAAGVIQPHLRRQRNTNNSIFAFQSYVSQIMFSNFQHQDFGIEGPMRDSRSFFAEFTELKFIKQKECFERKSRFRELCRRKYLALVHPKMEAAFFGNLEQRKLVSEGGGSPETDFFEVFAEMARQVWLLHCLFFSFKEEDKAVIFQARRGSRFSELYMVSVAEEEEEDGGDLWPAVGFTVLPGFRVGRTVIQCRVYLVYNNRSYHPHHINGSNSKCIMRCNACWRELESQAISTTCGHLLCAEDAGKILNNDGACPICDQVLSRSHIRPVDINPGDEWTNMAMAGVSPQILMKAAYRSVMFYIGQKELEMQYKMNKIIGQCRQKCESMQEKFTEKLEQVHTAYQKMSKRCQMMEQENASLTKDKQELQEKYAEKSRQKRKLEEMYDQLRSEHESMKRSAIQPANNFFPRGQSDLFSNMANMMDNRDPTRQGQREEIWPSVRQKNSSAVAFDLSEGSPVKMAPVPVDARASRPARPIFGAGVSNPAATLRNLIISPMKRPQLSRNRSNLFTL